MENDASSLGEGGLISKFVFLQNFLIRRGLPRTASHCPQQPRPRVGHLRLVPGTNSASYIIDALPASVCRWSNQSEARDHCHTSSQGRMAASTRHGQQSSSVFSFLLIDFRRILSISQCFRTVPNPFVCPLLVFSQL